MIKQTYIKYRAILLTTLLHGIVLLLCYLTIIKQPQKTEDEIGTGGIVVNYGFDEEGSGKDLNNTDEIAQSNTPINNPADQVVNPEQIPSNNKANSNPNNIVTQNIENAPPIPSQATTSNSLNTNNNPIAQKQTINADALFKAHQPKGASKGDGNTNKLGNQGSNNGDPNTANYGEGGSGNGAVKLDLDNRRFIVSPRIQDDGQSQGRIVIEIRVDKSGTVIYARAGDRGTTISDNQLWKKCENAVLGARVNPSNFAPETQSGKVVFHFKVR